MNNLKLKNKFIKLSALNRLHGINIPIIGLTGGIATGKSTASKLLKNLGLFVVDADLLVKEIYQKEKTIDFIFNLCPEVFEQEGVRKINFQKLREVFFNAPNSKGVQQQIEAFIYPQMKEVFLSKLNSNPSFIIYDVPLLFEKKLDALVDLKILIYASSEIQIERLMLRDKISKELARSILEQQWPIEKKRNLSDFVIENTNSYSKLEKDLNQLLEKITET